MKVALRSLISIIVWYAANLGILVTNKFIFAEMHYPIFLTLLHMTSCTIFSTILLLGTSLFKRKQVSARLILRKITGNKRSNDLTCDKKSARKALFNENSLRDFCFDLSLGMNVSVPEPSLTVLCAAQCGSIVFGNASLQYLAIRYALMAEKLQNLRVY